MRLSAVHCQGIKQVVGKTLGSSATVILFGSRLDDKARGGDDVRYGMLLSKNGLIMQIFYRVANESLIYGDGYGSGADKKINLVWNWCQR